MTEARRGPAWLEKVQRYRLGDGLLLFDADKNGPYMKYADVLAACPPPQEEPSEIETLRRALGNCYMMAKREQARLLNNPGTADAKALERWQHVLRFCEETGLKSSILRASFPAEITDGAASPPPSEARGWQPIETAPRDTVIIGALIRDDKVWRVHDMKHNGLAFYTVAGGSLPKMTHWMPLPDPPGVSPVPAASRTEP